MSWQVYNLIQDDFSIHNLPFGVFSDGDPSPRVGTRIGDAVVDLAVLASDEGVRQSVPCFAGLEGVFAQGSLNAFAALGRPVHRAVRAGLQRLLRQKTDLPAVLRDNAALRERAMVPADRVKMHLPMVVGDYTDFYAGYHHAYNVGCLFRGADDALQPNYTHLPVGYHGRASSIVVSGTPIYRPRGQVLPAVAPQKLSLPNLSLPPLSLPPLSLPPLLPKPPQSPQPEARPCRRLDFELELGCFVCTPNEMGRGVPVDAADEHIFGYVLLNDWSARDTQAWEYMPLGPFNAKNFATSISAWVVAADALEPFRAEPLPNPTPRLAYLDEARQRSVFDIRLKVHLTTQKGDTSLLAETSGRNLIWSFSQMLAHHTYGGCPMRTGDLLGSGTISGAGPTELGSLLERSKGGKVDVALEGGAKRRFLEDGDVVRLGGVCEREVEGEVVRVGFGECVGQILPAVEELEP